MNFTDYKYYLFLLSDAVSIVVPVYNSSGFLHKLIDAIERERIVQQWELELILVDDGSRDNSFEVIRVLAEKYAYIKGVKLARNFGHQIAVRTGLERVTNEFVAIIDDDLQDPPSLLAGFIEHLKNGFDVVYGVRKKRKEGFLKRLSYAGFYRLLKRVSEIEVPLDSGDFCVMRRQVVQNMLLLSEQHPFLRGMRSWVGFKQIGVEYERNSRIAGESGYTFKKLMKIAFDGIFSFSNVPIKLITLLGWFGFVFASAYSTYILICYAFNGIPVKGFTSIVILLSLFSSLILICLGIIGEYIIRIYDEVRKRPHSVISDTVNLS